MPSVILNPGLHSPPVLGAFCCKQDIALFLPTMVGPPEGGTGSLTVTEMGTGAGTGSAGSNGPVFLAFHVNCPNRYLSEESINNAREALGSSPAYILGRIILVEQHVASEVC